MPAPTVIRTPRNAVAAVVDSALHLQQVPQAQRVLVRAVLQARRALRVRQQRLRYGGLSRAHSPLRTSLEARSPERTAPSM